MLLFLHLILLSYTKAAYQKLLKFSKSLQCESYFINHAMRPGRYWEILCDINRIFAENSSALDDINREQWEINTLKNRRNSSGSPLLLINLTTQTPGLYLIMRISPCNGHFRLSTWWIGTLILPPTSSTSFDNVGVTTFCTCNAPTIISKSSSQGSIEWNWVNLSGGHKSLNRDARWVFSQYTYKHV